jgi:hypothetical protein
MTKLSWIRTQPPRPAPRRKPSVRPLLESLEDRCVPATFTVNSTADLAAPPAGTVTLRSAITAANTTAGADTINFDAALTGQTITLTATLTAITDQVTITGLGQKALTVNGAGAFRMIDLAAGVTASVTDLTLTQGSSGGAGTQGGAVRNLGGNLTLDHVTVSQSVANLDGGGIYNSAGGTTTINNSLLTNNTCTANVSSAGGAVASDSGTVTINTTTVSKNTSVLGGGLATLATATMILNRDTISGNTAQSSGFGGGVFSGGTSLQITNCTIADNISLGPGGGIRVNAGTFTSVNNTIAHNADLSNMLNASAGGISLAFGAPAATVTNTVVTHNFTVNPAQNERNVAVGFTDTTSLYTDTDLVGALQNNGGPTLTMAPLPGSGLIDAGTNIGNAPPTDQRGFLRQVGPTIDIGAVEFQPPAVTVTLTVTPTSPIPVHRVVTLDVTVTLATTSPAPNNPVTGTVTFLVNGTTVLGTATLDASGHATFTTSTNNPLPVGTDQITARYEGDSNYGPGLSNVVTQQVVRPIPTPAVFDPATATWYIRNSFSGGPPSITAFQFGSPGDLPIMGDWTGIGTFGIGVFTPSTATFHLRNSASPGAADFTFAFGPAGVGVPVAGDWDGDGIWTIGVFDPRFSNWNLRNENSAGLPDAGSFLYGAVGSKPVVGDWANTGQFSQGVVEPDGTWKLKNVKATGNPDFTFAYGAPGDQVVAGDWDGNGTWTPGVLEDNGAGALTWKLRNSNSAGPPDITPFTYGANTFLGLVGDPDFPVMPQFAADGQGPGAVSITAADLNGIVQAALGRLQQDGIAPDTLARLAGVTALVQPLAPGQLGGAIPQTSTILLSPNGAGHGWFVDPTPMQDEEFAGGTAYPGSPAAGREDLLTTVMHELGHLAGLGDNDGSALMGEFLPEGTRRIDLISTAFAAPPPVIKPLPTAPGAI